MSEKFSSGRKAPNKQTNIIKLHVNINMLQVDIDMSHVNIIILHVDH